MTCCCKHDTYAGSGRGYTVRCDDCPTHGHHHHLSRRDEFAKAAMNGLINANWDTESFGRKNPINIAKASVELAEELIAELDSSSKL